ncbi:hypothetical protein A2572_03380 [Candidatus Collierbacteria bacterium RIFOXYD1_FULL_40_9]|uniref:Uncharacterized protein n=1 Tax=Candidatus Collierbacteria bacterium RIFOXYD1_FULL_40_9 TaxID=1817731 RepID=A0A1F5FWZ5_9BACT|nr:MAG: hypothetical protein A2572_03380 [Candidatus Collierbacteria bacterium RIFOXYD1_FULL_40_9]
MTQSQLINHIEMQKPVSEYELNELAECKQISKREMSSRFRKPRKSTQLISSLLLTEDKRPPIEQEEVNRLAKAWCELMLGKVLEDRRNKTIRSAIRA